jgi:hypothetical protein
MNGLGSLIHLCLARIFTNVHIFAQFQHLSIKPDVSVAVLFRFSQTLWQKDET